MTRSMSLTGEMSGTRQSLVKRESTPLLERVTVTGITDVVLDYLLPLIRDLQVRRSTSHGCSHDLPSMTPSTYPSESGFEVPDDILESLPPPLLPEHDKGGRTSEDIWCRVTPTQFRLTPSEVPRT